MAAGRKPAPPRSDGARALALASGPRRRPPAAEPGDAAPTLAEESRDAAPTPATGPGDPTPTPATGLGDAALTPATGLGDAALTPAAEGKNVAPTPEGGALERRPSAEERGRYRALFEAFLAGRGPCTLRAYRQDFLDFQKFLGAPSVEQALGVLLGGGLGQGNAVALAYRAHLVDRQLAAATVNRRLAALRSLVKLGRTLGLVAWALEVEGLRTEALRDTRGPGVAGVRQALAWLQAQGTAKAQRDGALLRCLFDLGLRRGEVSGLDLAHLDLDAGVLHIQGKGRREREALTLPAPTQQALAAWVQARGTAAGPLFVAMDPASAGHRLTGTSIYKLIRQLGQRLGLRMRPHGLRHAAITEALDRTGGDLRKCQKFSRHKDVRTLLRYDDNRLDFAGEVAALIAL